MDQNEKLLSEALDIYRSGKTDKFHIAAGKLKKAEISEAMGLRLLQFAADLPKFPNEFIQPHADIVSNAARISNPRYFKQIRKDHLKYNKDAWKEVIRFLAQDGSNDSTETLQEILLSAVGNSELQLWEQLQVLLSEDETFADLPYLDWLEKMEGQDDEQAHHVRMILFAHLEKGWLDGVNKKRLSELLFSRLRLTLPSLAEKQRTTPGSWMFAEDYIEARNEVCEVIDLLGQLRFEAAREHIRQALGFADSRIKYFAMLALNEFGEDLNVKDVEEIANYPEMRGALVERLQGTHRFSLIPSTLTSQLALAESNLVDWLTFPTELNSVPDEIKFLKKTDVEGQAGQEMYFFRFRVDEPHWAAKDGWMTGWSGPFPRQGLAQLRGTDTFSEFEEWDGVESASVVSKLMGLFKPK
jgi:hypothetical protein